MIVSGNVVGKSISNADLVGTDYFVLSSNGSLILVNNSGIK